MRRWTVLFFFVLAVFGLCLPAIAGDRTARQSLASVVLSQPEEPFRGTIGFSASDSVPEWPQPVTAPKGAPNILLIMLDDVGFADTSTFGGVAQTPVLDRLAAEGLRYNRFHTAGICSPTRASLLSGRNPHRVGWGNIGEAGFPGYNGIWKRSTVSIAEVLRRNGYSTAAFGKWHNAPLHEVTPVGPFDRWPTGLGFDYFYGFMEGMTSQWEPSLWRNTRPVQLPNPAEPRYHLTTDLVDEAIRWIHTQESLASGRPYFLYFATGAAHSPHHVPPEWIAKYHGQFDQGWDQLRKEIFARQKTLGVIPADAELTPRPKELPAWTSLSKEEQRLFARQMEVYAAFIAHTDHEIGRLIDTVRAGSDGDDTLILYIVGDNGADGDMALSGWEDISVYFDPSHQPPIQERLTRIDTLGSPQYINHYATGWAWAGSTPFQWMKPVASHFGSTRNPLVVSWPAHIKDRGGVRSQFTHVNDVAATLYDVIGLAMPEVVDGVKQQPLDGVSFAHTFEKGDAPSSHRVQYFEVWGNRAIYQDGWMAAARHSIPWVPEQDENFADDLWELYRIEEDFSQAKNLAQQYPGRLRALQVLFDEQARSNHVYPLLTRYDSGSPATKGEGPFVYHAGFPGTPAYAAPNFAGASFRITADVAVPETGADGVILALGGRDGGFSLYVKENRLVFEANYYGRSRNVIRASTPLPEGKVEVRYEHVRDKKGPGGVGSLHINGNRVGTTQFQHGIAFSFDRFDIGQDSASPVSNAYQAPFAFTGGLEKVTVRLTPTASRPAIASQVRSGKD